MSDGSFLRCKDCRHDKGKCVGSTRRGRHKYCFEPKVMTNADRLRHMSDEELAKALNNSFDGEYCTNDPACGAMLDADGGISEEMCIACALKWLRQPVKEV